MRHDQISTTVDGVVPDKWRTYAVGAGVLVFTQKDHTVTIWGVDGMACDTLTTSRRSWDTDGERKSPEFVFSQVSEVVKEMLMLRGLSLFSTLAETTDAVIGL